MRNLFDDYIHERPELLAFYAGKPREVLASRPRTSKWDPALVEALHAYQERIGAQGRFHGDEAVIATGQQPGLLTGPLYTIYKAITAVRLARMVEEKQGVRCIPLFWIASDDHDFEEVRRTNVLGGDHKPLALTYEPEGDVQGFPMYRMPVDASLHGLIERARAGAQGGESDHRVAAFLHTTLDAAESFSDWFARILSKLFEDTPLVVFAPHLPEARRAAAPMIEDAVRAPGRINELLNETGSQLEALGYHQQVVKDAGDCSFFLEINGRRSKVLFDGSGYRAADAEACFSMQEMLDLLDASPERFSANVALRCLVQQRLFPVAAYVAGPGEIAYWGQLKPVFEHFDLSMPIVYPRARCTLTTLKLDKLRQRFGLVLGDLYGPRESLIERALRAVEDGRSWRIIREQRSIIEKQVLDLGALLAPCDPAAAEMAQAIHRHFVRGFDRLERAVLLRNKERADAAAAQVERLCNALAPFGKAQERVYTLASFLFAHDMGLVSRLIEQLDVASFSMTEVVL